MNQTPCDGNRKGIDKISHDELQNRSPKNAILYCGVYEKLYRCLHMFQLLADPSEVLLGYGKRFKSLPDKWW